VYEVILRYCPGRDFTGSCRDFDFAARRRAAHLFTNLFKNGIGKSLADRHLGWAKITGKKEVWSGFAEEKNRKIRSYSLTSYGE